jgi:hypothetical protein
MLHRPRTASSANSLPLRGRVFRWRRSGSGNRGGIRQPHFSSLSGKRACEPSSDSDVVKSRHSASMSPSKCFRNVRCLCSSCQQSLWCNKQHASDNDAMEQSNRQHETCNMHRTTCHATCNMQHAITAGVLCRSCRCASPSAHCDADSPCPRVTGSRIGYNELRRLFRTRPLKPRQGLTRVCAPHRTAPESGGAV